MHTISVKALIFLALPISLTISFFVDLLGFKLLGTHRFHRPTQTEVRSYTEATAEHAATLSIPVFDSGNYSKLWSRQDVAPIFVQTSYKGTCLLASINNRIPTTPNEYDTNLRRSGWSSRDTSTLRFPNLGNLLQANGWLVSDFTAHWWQYLQDWDYKPLEGYPDSGPWTAEYLFWTNTQDGVIICENTRSPRIPLYDPSGPQTRPAGTIIGHLSDFLFEVYQEQCNADPGCSLSGLQYIMRTYVGNRISTQVAQYIYQKKSGPAGAIPAYPQWPGWFWATGARTYENSFAEAIVGTPNGIAAAWMLWQHMPSFPQPMTIVRVHLWGPFTGILCFAEEIAPQTNMIVTQLPAGPGATSTRLTTPANGG